MTAPRFETIYIFDTPTTIYVEVMEQLGLTPGQTVTRATGMTILKANAEFGIVDCKKRIAAIKADMHGRTLQ